MLGELLERLVGSNHIHVDFWIFEEVISHSLEIAKCFEAVVDNAEDFEFVTYHAKLASNLKKLKPYTAITVFGDIETVTSVESACTNRSNALRYGNFRKTGAGFKSIVINRNYCFGYCNC